MLPATKMSACLLSGLSPGCLPVFVSPEKSRLHKSICCGNAVDQWCPVFVSSPDSMDNIFSSRRTQGGRQQFLQHCLNVFEADTSVCVWLAGTKPHMQPVVTKVEIHHAHDGDVCKLLSSYTMGARKVIMKSANTEFHVLLDCVFSSGVEYQPSLI